MPRSAEEVDYLRTQQSFRLILLAIAEHCDNAFLPLLLVQGEGDFGQQRCPLEALYNNVTHRKSLKTGSKSQVEEDDYHD
jgi:hypothetical protein